MPEFDHLLEALRQAIEEKKANPMSSRIIAVGDAAEAERRMAEAELDAVNAKEKLANESAARHGLPAGFIRSAWGNFPAERKRLQRKIAAAENVIAKAKKAEKET